MNDVARNAPTILLEPTDASAVVAYEQRLDADPEWAMSEGSRHFEERSAVHEALRRIAQRLDELGIPYAIAGGMALFRHGYRRFTEDVDVLVTPDGLKAIHEQLEGRGYLPPFERSKNLRDTELGVRIEFLVTGQFPGDGKPKPVSFPDPAQVAVELDSIKYLGIPTLVELKLASGMSGADRARDLADVQELIRSLKLRRSFSDKLDPYVRPKYEELWDSLHAVSRRYMRIWRKEWLTADAPSIGEMVRRLRAAADELAAMMADGVDFLPDAGTAGDCVYLVTTDPDIAAKYGMHEESEFMDGTPDGDE